jgi:hypothetical protein
MARTTSSGTSVDKYKKLLEKVNSLNLGGGGWWRPPVGTSTVRILPPVGSMDYFFVEVGQHYMDDKGKPFYCPAICSEGEKPCPICEINEELFRAGEKDAAGKFRASRSFFMNIIDRANPGQGVQKYAPGTTIFQAITSMISDPDYGDISDAAEGYDIKIERVGEGRENTKYQVSPVKRSTPLGTQEQMDEWLAGADDMKAYVMNQLLEYEDLAKKSGVDVYFTSADDEEDEPEPPKKAAPAKPAAPTVSKKDAPVKAETEDEDDEDEEDDDEEPPAKSASQSISERMKARTQQAQLLKRK